ncbi:hypothetical protein PR048_029414 [Dryococelus australis]|uniref:Uncharacterized protein n=1 Tax=Dryococelus australis TaxID=614101 RepID=A0ABQ9GDN4_9NEOP|nr:hypothetical protein PR048_029414 [Dryococelus australis]
MLHDFKKLDDRRKRALKTKYLVQLNKPLDSAESEASDMPSSAYPSSACSTTLTKLPTNGRAAVVEWLDCSPCTKANWVKFPAGSLPDIRRWELWCTMLLIGRFSLGSLISIAFAFQCCSILTSLSAIQISQLINDMPGCCYEVNRPCNNGSGGGRAPARLQQQTAMPAPIRAAEDLGARPVTYTARPKRENGAHTRIVQCHLNFLITTCFIAMYDPRDLRNRSRHNHQESLVDPGGPPAGRIISSCDRLSALHRCHCAPSRGMSQQLGIRQYHVQVASRAGSVTAASLVMSTITTCAPLSTCDILLKTCSTAACKLTNHTNMAPSVRPCTVLHRSVSCLHLPLKERLVMPLQSLTDQHIGVTGGPGNVVDVCSN